MKLDTRKVFVTITHLSLLLHPRFLHYEFHLEKFCSENKTIKEIFNLNWNLSVRLLTIMSSFFELYSSPFIYMKKSSVNIPLNFSIVFQRSHMVLERHEGEVNDDRFFMSRWTIPLNPVSELSVVTFTVIIFASMLKNFPSSCPLPLIICHPDA